MPRRTLVLSLLALAPVAATSCAHDDPVRVGVETNLTLPRGVLDRARKLELRVLEGQVTCEETTGVLTGEASAKEIAKSELGTSCAAGAKFCGDLTIEKSDALRIFAAKALDDGGSTLAVGCKAAKVDQDALPLTIRMFRYLAPAQCNDGTVQPTEQCEPGGSAICDDDCQSKEIVLSVGSASTGTEDGTPGQKTDPAFLWPAGAGDGGRFFAFYTDRAGGGGNVEVSLRVMAADFLPLTTPPALAAGSIFLPNGGAFPPQRAPRNQALPQAAVLGGKTYVVFEDDDSSTSTPDIHLRSITSSLTSEQGPTPLAVNGTAAGEPLVQTAPSIAASQGKLYVAWQDGQKIVGRTLTPPSTLGSQNDLSTGTGNARPQVAATTTGWVVVWNSGTGVKLRAINADGTPGGAEQPVSNGGAPTETPHVASLADGRFCVAWAAGGDVFFQRYDAKGGKLDGDQSQPVNDVFQEGEQKSATVAAIGGAAGGAYVVAWHDASTGHIRARFLGGSAGFLFNNVNGQSTEFQASRDGARDRANPVAASGGSGPSVVIGWEDRTSPGHGIIGRRFPLPSE